MRDNNDKTILEPAHGILDLPPLNIPEDLFDDKRRKDILDNLKEKTGDLYKTTLQNMKELYENTYWKRTVDDMEEYLYISRIAPDLSYGFATIYKYSDFQLYMVRKNFELSKTKNYEKTTEMEFQDNFLGIVKHLYYPHYNPEIQLNYKFVKVSRLLKGRWDFCFLLIFPYCYIGEKF